MGYQEGGGAQIVNTSLDYTSLRADARHLDDINK